MTDLPLHPALVHLPLGIAAITPFVALALAVAWWRGWLPRRAWWLAAFLQVTVAATAFIALETGEDAEEAAEDVAPEAAIHEHEEAAEAFLWLAVATGVLGILAGTLRKEQLALGIATASVVASGVVTGFGVVVGHRGGELVYVHGAASAYATPGGAPHEGHDEGDEDSD